MIYNFHDRNLYTEQTYETSVLLCIYFALFVLFQIIAEGANGPTTIEADKIFIDRNILVIPVGLTLDSFKSLYLQ